MILSRALLAFLAVIACAWFALGVHQTDDEQHAATIVSGLGRLTSAQTKQAGSLLDSAGTLDPDGELDILRAQLSLHEGHPRAAERTLEALVRREPQNIEGWAWLAQATVTADPPVHRIAVAYIQALAPPVPAP